MKTTYIWEAFRIMGPAFLVSVAYLDPGNWATAIEAGSRFGYELVWVVVASNLIAILLQTLAARLGIVTGKHLAQVCRESYPPLVCWLLWALCEVSIVALDLTMLLGTAIGLNLLLGWPLLPCILMTGLDALLLLLLVPAHGVKKSEALTVGLLAVVVGCFMVDLLVSRPPLRAVVGGLAPRLLRRETLYTAVSLLGANVMPHNFYLHSALVSGQARGCDGSERAVRALCFYNFLDIAAALGVALIINVAVLLVSAATFHEAGVVVQTLQDAHDLMEQTLSSTVAPAAFGMALLCAGQLSTFTGTIAGQVVLQGFLNVHISTWLRRLATRSAAIIPAAVLQYVYGDRGTYKFLLIAQVVLALQLPVTLVPLIKATSSRALMGSHRNSLLLAGAAWAATALVFAANLMLFVTQLLPQVSTGRGILDKDGPLDVWIDTMAELVYTAPMRFAGLMAAIIGASAFLALQLWMIITPLRYSQDGASATAGADALGLAVSGNGGADDPLDGGGVLPYSQTHGRHGNSGGGAKAVAAGSSWQQSHYPSAAHPGALGEYGWQSQQATAYNHARFRYHGSGLHTRGGGPMHAPGGAGGGPWTKWDPTIVQHEPGAFDPDPENPTEATGHGYSMPLLPWPRAVRTKRHRRRAAADRGRAGDHTGAVEGHQKMPTSASDTDDELSSSSDAAGGGWSRRRRQQERQADAVVSDDPTEYDTADYGGWLSGRSVTSVSGASSSGMLALSPVQLLHTAQGHPRDASPGAAMTSADDWEHMDISGGGVVAASGGQLERAAAAGVRVMDSLKAGSASPCGGDGGGGPAGPGRGAARPAHPVSRGNRRQFAALLDEFWAGFYDQYGNAVGAGQGQQQQGRGQKAGGAAAAAEPAAAACCSPLLCSHTGGSHLCMACSQALFTSVQSCLRAVERLEGAAAALWGPWPLQLLPAGPSGSPTFHYHRQLVQAASRSDFAALHALCRGVFSSATDRSKLLAATPITQPAPGPERGWSGAAAWWGAAGGGGGQKGGEGGGGPPRAGAAGARQQQLQQQQQPGRSGHGGPAAATTQQQRSNCIPLFSMPAPLQQSPVPAGTPAGAHVVPAASGGNAGSGSGSAGPAPVLSDWCLFGPASLVGFGVWCALTLMQWCMCEVRPELWGRYAYIFNRLQGVLLDAGLDVTACSPLAVASVSSSASLERCSSSGQDPMAVGGTGACTAAALGMRRSSGGEGAGSGAGMTPPTALRLAGQHAEALRQDLLAQLGALEEALAERHGPADSAAGVVAFPKGKEIILSVVRRYRRKLTGAAASTPRAGGAARAPLPLPERQSAAATAGSVLLPSVLSLAMVACFMWVVPPAAKVA